MGAAISEKLREISKHLLELSNIVATCEDWERRLEVVQAAPGETLDRRRQVPFDRVEVGGLSELEGLIEGLRERKEQAENSTVSSYMLSFLQDCSAALRFCKAMQAMSKNARYHIYVLTRMSGKLFSFPTVLQSINAGVFDDMKVQLEMVPSVAEARGKGT